jgi:hypothetical protein
MDNTELIIAILSAISVPIIVYFVKIEFRIRHLEKHPFLEGINDVNKQDAIDVYRRMRAMKESKGDDRRND